MPWCTKCKMEYQNSFDTCPTCNIPLVDELAPTFVPIAHDEKEKCNKLVNFLEYSNMKSYYEYEEVSDSFVVYVTEEDEKEALKLYKVFLENSDEELEEENKDDKKINKPKNIYVKKADTLNDLKSSAYSLLVIGTIGLIALILQMLGVFNLNLNPSSKYLVYITMGAVFIFFIVFGILSFIKAKTVAKEAIEEDEFTTSVNNWLKENITANTLETIVNSDDTNELKYFKRNEKIKELITEKFGDIDEAFLDKLSDDHYSSLYE